MDSVTCLACGETVTIEGCDVIGACDGSMFCFECGAEIDADTGEPTLLCGECYGCGLLRDHDTFDVTQQERQALRDKIRQQQGGNP